MLKKILILSIIVIFPLSIISLVLAFQNPGEEIDNEVPPPRIIEADILMPSKSSRPGCEETNSCYIPHEITIKREDTVTWKNEDVAFHSVTSGHYGNPDGLFDSGHLDPDQTFSYEFQQEGVFDYHCTLHPWMKGKVTVNS